MKKILTLAFALMVTLSIGAVRPIHKLFPVKQGDGTTVMLYKNGDGHLAFYTTEDNKVVVRDADGNLCYGELNAAGNLVASSMRVHNIADRSEAEAEFVSSITLKPGDEALRPLLLNPRVAQAKKMQNITKRVSGSSTSDGLGQFGVNSGARVPSIGNITIPVIMVAYQDKDFQSEHTVARMSRYFNDEGYHEDYYNYGGNYYDLEVGSVKDYFKAQSYGHFVPTFDVVAKVTLDHPYAYYGANEPSSNSGGNDVRAQEMIRDAVAKAVEQGVDFSQYYVNGVVPNVTIMYAGLGEATGGDENTIWPHELDLKGFSYTNWRYTDYATWSGYNFGSYFVGNEMYDDTNIMGMGVFCHEFSHALGLPDFYNTDYSYSNDSPFGYWSVMDGGEYTNGGYAPVGYTAYERSFMGWLDIKELTDAQSVTLENPSNTDAAYAVMVRNPDNANEYFILENRQPDTWYSTQLGSGLMVSRFVFDRESWTYYNNVNNTQDKKRAMIVTADGSVVGASNSLESQGNQNHLFGNGVDYVNSLPLYDGSKLRSASFTNIVKHNDGTVTFDFSDTFTKPEIANDGREFVKVTDLAQLSSGDSIIIVNEVDSMAMTSNTMNHALEAAYLNLSDGNLAYGNADLVSFIVRNSGNSWAFQSDNGYLVMTENGVAILSNISRNNHNYIINLAFNSGNASVLFPESNNRYLGYSEEYFGSYADNQNNVQIYRLRKPTDGIASVNAVANDKKADSRIFTLSGQYVGNTLKGLPQGIYIQNGKKVVVK